MSTVWIVMLVVGAAGFAFRLLPIVAVERIGLSPRTANGLRHAGSGAVAALVVLAILGPGSLRPDPAVLVAVALGGFLAWRGWSMTRVVVAGGATYALVAVAIAVGAALL
jgi:branched-subunit amino acid transport protein